VRFRPGFPTTRPAGGSAARTHLGHDSQPTPSPSRSRSNGSGVAPRRPPADGLALPREAGRAQPSAPGLPPAAELAAQNGATRTRRAVCSTVRLLGRSVMGG
jgi:hypothetical protein